MSADADVAQISGNASAATKRALSKPANFFGNHYPNIIKKPIFGEGVFQRMKIVEVSVRPKPEEPKKMEGRVTVELDVLEDMLNGGAAIHGACSAFLIDMCSTLALTALQLETNGEKFIGVSQTMNIMFHSPATLGDKLRVVNTSIATGARALSSRTEIWNVTHHRLVSSGSQIKMREREQPQSQKQKQKSNL